MTALSMLLSGALWLLLLSLFGQPAVIAVALALVLLSLAGVVSDARAYIHDRDTAARRLTAMGER